ncbi:thiamine phosphate synthase [Bacillus sp. DJP31]|uniref:thiamine phosphate synthase n=1 Tax=Bacillus sp. DJP31 TaxID=3409789 RepID=UPI003BB4F2DE
MGIHLVSNGKLSLKDFAEIASKVDVFVDYFHIREKQKTAFELYEGIQWLLDAGIAKKKIIINDRVDVAVALGVSGVQLAHHSLQVKVVRSTFPNLTIGCSTHSLPELQKGEKGGADYAFFGHIFHSSSKLGLEPRGCKLLEEFSKNISLPIIAIGGITPENTKTVLNHGASGIAVISGILDAKDPHIAAERYSQVLTKWKEEQHETTL